MAVSALLLVLGVNQCPIVQQYYASDCSSSSGQCGGGTAGVLDLMDHFSTANTNDVETFDGPYQDPPLTTNKTFQVFWNPAFNFRWEVTKLGPEYYKIAHFDWNTHYWFYTVYSKDGKFEKAEYPSMTSIMRAMAAMTVDNPGMPGFTAIGAVNHLADAACLQAVLNCLGAGFSFFGYWMFDQAVINLDRGLAFLKGTDFVMLDAAGNPCTDPNLVVNWTRFDAQPLPGIPYDLHELPKRVMDPNKFASTGVKVTDALLKATGKTRAQAQTDGTIVPYYWTQAGIDHMNSIYIPFGPGQFTLPYDVTAGSALKAIDMGGPLFKTVAASMTLMQMVTAGYFT
jgi:hypothetical protein